MRGSWLIAVVAAAVVGFSSHQVDERLGRYRAQEEVLYLWSGEHLKRLAPGFENVLADIYWIRTVQYYGGMRAFDESKRYDLLEPLTRITTTLDPHFEIAYRYGAIFLAEEPPGGAGLPEAAVELLRRGVENNPDNWYLWQYLAYSQFIYLDDYEGAVASLKKAQTRPLAPLWVRTLAASFLVQRGQRERARSIWLDIYRTSGDGPIRENARERLQSLDALDETDALSARAQRFHETHGRYPAGWRDLALRAEPRDPSGVPYEYRADTGEFRISRSSLLYSVKYYGE